jgi:hypothetical protein
MPVEDMHRAAADIKDSRAISVKGSLEVADSGINRAP